jgi:hypothetical protein
MNFGLVSEPKEENVKTFFMSAAALFLLTAAWAADPFDVKPGLWETSVTTDLSGASGMPAMPNIPPEVMAKMPAAQRAQVEALMKSRGGTAAPITNKVCVTRSSVDEGSFGRTDKSCTSKVVSSSASKQVLQIECERNDSKMTGELTVERVDSEHVKGSVVMKTPQGQTKMTFENRWLSADCGDVRPAGK